MLANSQMVKKGIVWSLAILLSASFASSCTDKDEVFSTDLEGEEITASITVEVPEMFRSRAIPNVYPSDAAQYIGESGQPSMLNVDLKDNPLTFTVGVYVEKQDGDNTVYTLVSKQDRTGVSDDKADFNFQLMKGQKYRIVAYADYNATPKDELDDISITPSLNDETSDAFFASRQFEASDKKMTVVLKRPFGKLRLIARDFSTFAKGEVLTIDNVKVTYAETATALATNSFNAITGEFNAINEGVTRDFTAAPAVYAQEHEGGTDGYAAVFTMYLPANLGVEDTSGDYDPTIGDGPVPQSWSYPFNIEVTYKNDKNETTTVARSFDIDVPIKRNWLTTIDAKNFWTDNSDITVSIDYRFEGEINKTFETATVNSASELQDAIDAICLQATSPSIPVTGKIVLGNDINANDGGVGGFVFSRKVEKWVMIDIYLDLAGHTIYTDGSEWPEYDALAKDYAPDKSNPRQKTSIWGIIAVRSNYLTLHISDSSADATGGIEFRGGENPSNLKVLNGVQGQPYPCVTCMNGGSVVIDGGRYINTSSSPVVYVYEQAANRANAQILAAKAYRLTGKPTITDAEKAKYEAYIATRLTARATVNSGWFENAQPASTAENKKVTINSYNLFESDWTKWSTYVYDAYKDMGYDCPWLKWEGEYNPPVTLGYVYLNGGSYVDFDPATGDNMSGNRPNRWVDDNHTVLTETVEGHTVYTVIPNNSPEYNKP